MDKDAAKIKWVLKLYGALMSFGMFIVAWIIWTMAYLNGGEVILAINLFGEMEAELLFMIISVPLTALGVWWNIKEMFNE